MQQQFFNTASTISHKLASTDPKNMSADQEQYAESLMQYLKGQDGGGGLADQLKNVIDAYHAAHPDTQQA
ncbi:hypothetical protein IHE33_12705 (plasmid) [Mycetohabitans endofungorum]